MNFLVDAQLPGRLARQLRDAGHDAIHCEGLMAALAANLPEIKSALAEVQFVELSATSLVVHEDRRER